MTRKTNIVTVKAEEETKIKFFNSLMLDCPQDAINDRIVINYSKQYRKTDINGNSNYNYKFYGMDIHYGRIYDHTWQLASILSSRYDTSKCYIIDDENAPQHIQSKLNKFNEENNLNYKEIVLKEII